MAILRERRATDVIHRAFEQVAKASPDRVALVFEDHQVSYSALNRRSDAVAVRLLQDGVAPEDVVAIGLERSAELVAGSLGILKAGAAYLPLDPAYPRDRLQFMLLDSGARLVLVGDGQRGMFRGLGVREMVLSPADRPRPREPEPTPRFAAPDSLAYVMYTSGSTGHPKGIMVSHQAVINHVRWRSERFALGRDDRTLQRTPTSFDISAWEIFGSLLTGGTLVLPRPGAQRESACLVDAIIEHEVTAFQIVPSMLKLMLREPKIRKCRSVRRLFSGGEVLSRDLAAACQAALDATLVNVYGPTETTIDTTFWICGRTVDGAGVPIGHPIANTTAVVLNAAGHPTRPTEEGTLFIGGRGLARGYWRRPDRTAESFVPCASAREPGERLYNTGDVVRLSRDGALEFIGRRDGQVKVRGMRVELQEIEQVLKECPLVSDGLAMTRATPAGDQKIVCYYVQSPQAHAASVNAFRHTRYHDIRNYLAGRLPLSMQPHHVVNVDALPLLPSGKVNTKALPEPAYYTPGTGDAAAPQTDKERLLARVWCDVLGVPAVGCEDLFAYYGGDSLQMVEVRLAAQQRGLLLDLSVRHQSATVRSLARSAVWTSDRRATWTTRLRELARCGGLYGRARALELLDVYRQRRTLALEGNDRRRFREFYAGLENTRDIYYLFFRSGLLHWVAKQLELVPDDVNVVLVGTALAPAEQAWVRERLRRPFFHVEVRIDNNAAWEMLFETNERNFGWMDVGCFVNNSSLFRELARIDDDVAFNCIFTHTERHRRTFIEHFLFVNVRAIRAVANRRIKVYPSGYHSRGLVRRHHQWAYHRVPTARDRALVRRMLLEEAGTAQQQLSEVVASQKVFQLDFFIGHLFLIYAQRLGFRIHRVRHLTAPTHLNYHNFFTDEVIVAPHVLYYEDTYGRQGGGFVGDLERTLQADYLLLRSMCAELPPSYATQLGCLQVKILERGIRLEDAARNVTGHLIEYGVSPQVFDRPQWSFLRDEAASPRAAPHGSRGAVVDGELLPAG